MKCPGQDTQYWKSDAIFEVKCPKCDRKVEFFKDDTTRKCGGCGHRFLNPELDFGCASYCQFAEQCLGNLPPELLAQKEELLKDRVAVAVKRYFKSDFKQIGHSTKVARYAERIGRNEGANLAVVLSAAYLHDIGLPEAVMKFGDKAADHHEAEGEMVARRLLEELAAQPALIDAVCKIVRRHHSSHPDTDLEFKSVYDADRIANLEALQKKNPLPPETLLETIETKLLTESGRVEARKVLLSQK
jgi:putative nucleotidyltransferase with HDIG domain